MPVNEVDDIACKLRWQVDRPGRLPMGRDWVDAWSEGDAIGTDEAALVAGVSAQTIPSPSGLLRFISLGWLRQKRGRPRFSNSCISAFENPTDLPDAQLAVSGKRQG
jgi:hypothetical protein